MIAPVPVHCFSISFAIFTVLKIGVYYIGVIMEE